MLYRHNTRENIIFIDASSHLDVEVEEVAKDDASGVVILDKGAHAVRTGGRASGEDALVDDGLLAHSGGALDVTELTEVTLGGVNSNTVEALRSRMRKQEIGR